jgi:two-component system CheB/CheR fusion protein
VRHNLDIRDLDALIAGVIDSGREDEREVLDADGRWLSLHVRPYLSTDNKVDGAVLVLVDIDALKRAEQTTAAAREYADNIIDTLREPLVVLDGALRVERVNRAFCDTFAVTPTETVGTLFYDLGNRQWDIPELRGLLDDVVTQSRTIEELHHHTALRARGPTYRRAQRPASAQPKNLGRADCAGDRRRQRRP